jgi:hypothetical protein
MTLVVGRLMRFVALSVALSVSVASAQDRPDALVTDGSSSDPIAVDRDLSSRQRASFDSTLGPRPPAVGAAAGQALTAIPGVREARHEVRVELLHGLADVRVELELTSRARHPAEVKYRLAVPAGARIASLEVCVEARCRQGTLDPAPDRRASYEEAVRARGPGEAIPVAIAAIEIDERGTAIDLRAAPVARDAPMVVRVRYVAASSTHGGVTRVVLPARGRDPRAAAADVSVRAEGLLSPAVDGIPADAAPISLDPWLAAPITARLPTSAAPASSMVEFACGHTRCARVRVVAGPARRDAETLFLLIDASRSTEGPARGRMGAAVTALVSVAPERAVVHAVAFGASAERVLPAPERVESLSLAPILGAVTRDLGPATRLDAAWEAIERELARAREPHVILVGDGTITPSPEGARVFDAAIRRGVRLSIVNAADAPVANGLRERAERTGGVVLDLADEASSALAGSNTGPLEERIGALFARVLASRVAVRANDRAARLLAGEELVWEGVIGSSRPRVRGVRAAPVFVRAEPPLAIALAARGSHEPLPFVAAGADAVQDACNPRGPAARSDGVSSDEAPVALAAPRDCEAPLPVLGPTPSSEPGRGVPAETVLSMLRQRVIPSARQCLRRDRAGRADYSVRARFDLELANGEIIAASVDGDLEAPLRECLSAALETLHVPRFEGVVIVHYPIYTARDAPPPTVELRPDVGGSLDRMFGTARGEDRDLLR